MPFEVYDPYEFEEKKANWKSKGEYYLALIFRAMFYLLKIIFKLALSVFLNVLRTFGIKIGNSRDAGWA